jgi:hypothetical protein
MNFGYSPSELDGTEIIIDNILDTVDIPVEYSYVDYLPNVYDQGNKPTCVPHAISAFVDWYNLTNGIDKDMSIDWIFDCRKDKDAEGMSMKEALNYIKHVGYTTKQDYKNIKKGNEPELEHINMYGMLKSIIPMQRSLLVNGPFILSLPVYDTSRSDFWNGDKFEGGHSVSCVGYNKDGLIIRNSWGTMWGNNGYCVLPYSQFNKIYEAWALIKY